MKVSPLAVVHPGARIAENVSIDPFAIVEAGVSIGSGSHIKSHAVIYGRTQIGRDCVIYPGAILGAEPQDLKYQGEDTVLRIGDRSIIREYCTINKGTKASGTTEIGNDVLVMAYSHIAHDCRIGDHVVISNNVHMAGHVRIESHAIIGGMTAIQQFIAIGESAYVGGGTLVRKDVPPFVKAAREPLAFVGVNVIGLRRRGWEEHLIDKIRDIYRILMIQNQNLSVGMQEVTTTQDTGKEGGKILRFIRESPNGIIRGYRQEPES